MQSNRLPLSLVGFKTQLERFKQNDINDIDIGHKNLNELEIPKKAGNFSLKKRYSMPLCERQN